MIDKKDEEIQKLKEDLEASNQSLEELVKAVKAKDPTIIDAWKKELSDVERRTQTKYAGQSVSILRVALKLRGIWQKF